jgi:hypothetical protein
MARLNNGVADSVRSWGPGYNDGPDYYAAPTWYHNRGIQITNNTGKDLFLPDNSEAERNAVYRNRGAGYGFTGNWVDSAGRLRRDQVAVGIYCWSGPNFNFAADPQPTPPACESAYTDGGVYATNAAMPDYGNGPKTYRPPYDGTVAVTDWAATYGENLDVTIAGATRNAIYMCQSLAQGYFWNCSSSFPYQWIVVRACYKS